MVRFWSDHFNIDLSKGECKWLKPAEDRDVIRPNAMGKFTDLLAAATKSQAMLTYLDGRKIASTNQATNQMKTTRANCSSYIHLASTALTRKTT